MGREDDREREREKGRVTAGHHCSRLGGQWCPRRQDAIRAGWIVNGVLDDAIMDEPWSKSESAREREREREKSDGSKIALEQKEKKTERDRETNSEGRTPLDPVGVSMVSSRTRLVTRPSACARARA